MANIIRNYEVSVWTLQDSFITVLKPYSDDFRNITQIEDPNLKLQDDGTEEFNFSIPMYIRVNGEKVENPIWMNVVNGTIIANLRKIKIIFNKHDSEKERVFEMIIVGVEERHDKDQLYCDVTCEGLAFHELGKVGYRISLSSEDYNEEDFEWFIGDQSTPEPRATLDYWNRKMLVNRTDWTYEVQMDWAQFTGYNPPCDNTKVYEDEYVSSWTSNGDVMSASAVERTKEKERLVDLEESNIYNISQELAKTFGVFCRYEYGHDINYHITTKKIIYYNTFLREKEGLIDLTYPYNTSKISREMDSKDTITKMFVTSVEDEQQGEINITNVAANKMKEDYLLNFEYLHNTGAISEEQYRDIAIYEKTIYTLNTLIKELDDKIINWKDQLPEVEAVVTFAKNAISLDEERIHAADDLLNALLDKSPSGDALERTASNPDTAIRLDDNSIYPGCKYIKITQEGLLADTLKIYKTYNFQTGRLDQELTTGVIKYDEFGNVIGVYNLEAQGSGESAKVYLTYKYIPQLQYENVKRVWTARLGKDRDALVQNQALLDQLNEDIDKAENGYDDDQGNHVNGKFELIAQKQKVIADFDQMMGPALREGYWTPEEYNDYGNKHSSILTIPNNYSENTSNDLASFEWDTEAFKEEQKLTFLLGADTVEHLYYWLDLSSYLNQAIETDQNNNSTTTIRDCIDNLCVIFFDNNLPAGQRNTSDRTVIAAGSECVYGFVKNGENQVVPALIVLKTSEMSEDSLKRMTGETVEGETNNYNPCLGIIVSTFDTNSNSPYTLLEKSVPINKNHWHKTITPSEVMVYPRVKINSLALKLGENELGVTYGSQLFKEFENYSVLSRSDLIGGGAYYITLRPQDMIKQSLYQNVRVKYNISNADTSIYLDAIQVLKENSQPKVSYTIDISPINLSLIETAYNQIGKIANINDTDLKFKNIQGYISEADLKLDKPWEDSFVIKNYKTKFEDLFSTIVAQTEQMQKNSYTTGMVASAFTTTGALTDKVVKEALRKVDFDYAFNNGSLTIDDANGIWGTSDSGVVAFRGGGIFTAYEKDINDNWIWNTGITPEGINADLITAGQLDTNKIKIYAGDKLRLQINGDGLFAYKSYSEDLLTGASNATVQAVITAGTLITDPDTKQYVTVNENGLFLIAEPGAKVLDSNHAYVTINPNGPTVERVAISWDGLTLRNYSNTKVFYADADNGNLTVDGTIFARNLYIGSNEDEITQYITAHSSHVYVQSSMPTDYKQGEIWHDNSTTPGKEYIALNNVGQSPSMNDWQQISAGTLLGTALTVNSNTGNISMTATNNLEIASGQSLNISTLGELNITGAGGVNITSGGNLNVAANGNVAIALGNGTNGTGGTFTIGNKFSVNSAGAVQLGSWTVDNTRLHSGSNGTYVGLDSNSSNTYAIWAGATEGYDSQHDTYAPFSVTKGGVLRATNATISGTLIAGNNSSIAGWSVNGGLLYSGQDYNTNPFTSTYVALDSNTTDDYAIWAGNSNAGSAPFRVKRDGTVYLTNLYTTSVDPENPTETKVNLSNYDFWKLRNATVLADGLTSSVIGSQVYIYLKTTAGTLQTNFTKPTAAPRSITGDYSPNPITLYRTDGSGGDYSSLSKSITVNYDDNDDDMLSLEIDASRIYKAGANSVTANSTGTISDTIYFGGNGNYGVSIHGTLSNGNPFTVSGTVYISSSAPPDM